MADNNTVLHRFHSAIADDPSAPQLVRPSNWNEQHLFTGGADGDLLTRDTSKTDGVSFKNPLLSAPGRLLDIETSSGTYNGTSPSPNIGNLTLNLAQSTQLVLLIEASLLDSLASLFNATLFVKKEGSTILTYTVLNRAENATFIRYYLLPLGTHNYSASFGTSNPPIVQCSVLFTALLFI